MLQNFKRFSHKAHLLTSGSNNGYRSLLKTPMYSQVIHNTEVSLNCIKLKFIIVTATLGLLHPWRLMLWSTRNLFIFPKEQGADTECDKYDACSCIQWRYIAQKKCMQQTWTHNLQWPITQLSLLMRGVKQYFSHLPVGSFACIPYIVYVITFDKNG